MPPPVPVVAQLTLLFAKQPNCVVGEVAGSVAVVGTGPPLLVGNGSSIVITASEALFAALSILLVMLVFIKIVKLASGTVCPIAVGVPLGDATDP